MDTTVFLFVEVHLNDESELHDVLGVCDFLFIHPQIKGSEIMCVTDIQGVDCLEVNVTLHNLLS